MKKDEIYSDLFVKKEDNDELKVDRDKVQPETFDAVVKLLDGNADPDVKRAAKLLTVLKDKFGYPGSKKEKVVEKKIESPEDVVKVIDASHDFTVEKAGKKLSKEALDLVKGAFDKLKALLEKVTALANDDDVKKFVEENEEVDPEKIAEAVEDSIKKAMDAKEEWADDKDGDDKDKKEKKD